MRTKTLDPSVRGLVPTVTFCRSASLTASWSESIDQIQCSPWESRRCTPTQAPQMSASVQTGQKGYGHPPPPVDFARTSITNCEHQVFKLHLCSSSGVGRHWHRIDGREVASPLTGWGSRSLRWLRLQTIGCRSFPNSQPARIWRHWHAAACTGADVERRQQPQSTEFRLNKHSNTSA